MQHAPPLPVCVSCYSVYTRSVICNLRLSWVLAGVASILNIVSTLPETADGEAVSYRPPPRLPASEGTSPEAHFFNAFSLHLPLSWGANLSLGWLREGRWIRPYEVIHRES